MKKFLSIALLVSVVVPLHAQGPMYSGDPEAITVEAPGAMPAPMSPATTVEAPGAMPVYAGETVVALSPEEMELVERIRVESPVIRILPANWNTMPRERRLAYLGGDLEFRKVMLGLLPNPADVYRGRAEATDATGDALRNRERYTRAYGITTEVLDEAVKAGPIGITNNGFAADNFAGLDISEAALRAAGFDVPNGFVEARAKIRQLSMDYNGAQLVPLVEAGLAAQMNQYFADREYPTSDFRVIPD